SLRAEKVSNLFPAGWVRGRETCRLRPLHPNPLLTGSWALISPGWKFVDGGGYEFGLPCILRHRRSRWCILILLQGYLFATLCSIARVAPVRVCENTRSGRRVVLPSPKLAYPR